jgi:hypothetical protein
MDPDSHSDEQIEENKDGGDHEITESVKSFIQEKLGGRSKPELTRELSTKGFEEEEEPLDEHDGGRFDEVNMQATGD